MGRPKYHKEKSKNEKNIENIFKNFSFIVDKCEISQDDIASDEYNGNNCFSINTYKSLKNGLNHVPRKETVKNFIKYYNKYYQPQITFDDFINIDLSSEPKMMKIIPKSMELTWN